MGRPSVRDSRVFISAVTRELGSVRKLVTDAVLGLECLPIVQDHFPPDHRDVLAMLRDRISGCDAVIHIAGHCYGFEPKQRPPESPRRSYTQLEYEIAVELGKPVYLFLTGEGFPTDPHDPEPPDLQELQQAHRQRLTSTDKLYTESTSADQLGQLIRSLRLKVDRLEGELHQVDQKVGRAGRRIGHWLALVAVLVLAALGSIGYVAYRQQVQQRRLEAEHQAQERERVAAEAARQQAQTIQQFRREVAEWLLQDNLASLLQDTNRAAEAEPLFRRALAIGERSLGPGDP